MRLSEWRKRAPARDTLGPRALAVVEPVLAALGSERDPHACVAWGDDPTSRYSILVPTTAGLIVCHVRAGVPGNTPRTSAKLVRWSRVQVGELIADTQADHRVVSFQIENYVLRAPDEAGDEIAAFAVRVLPAIDGRPLPDPIRSAAASGARRSGPVSEAGRKPASGGGTPTPDRGPRRRSSAGAGS